MESLSHLVSHLATSSNRAKAVVLTDIFGMLILNLVREKMPQTMLLSRCLARWLPSTLFPNKIVPRL